MGELNQNKKFTMTRVLKLKLSLPEAGCKIHRHSQACLFASFFKKEKKTAGPVIRRRTGLPQQEGDHNDFREGSKRNLRGRIFLLQGRRNQRQSDIRSK
ncbi:MAG TPA: hypothetical protein DCM07_05015 [Planctomycetaceae bacterium]|nr:hypothetical protein [Gimesia sp.]HAH44208.1 hypothetical protein [Planctomycetaceae bacterium]HBL42721.1 hypothetical protein [Planctomycetaceae bacterium]|tara:strand:- start:11639 stop:11935 length:297 start_codon:yes stop_codon:yes gene_type:complete